MQNKPKLIKIKSIFSDSQDENRDPLQRGYSRVDTAEGSLSASSTSTSLDTVLIEANNELLPYPRHNISAPATVQPAAKPSSSPRPPNKHAFSPILESDETLTGTSLPATSLTDIVHEKHSTLKSGGDKGTLRSSKVSFEQTHVSSDEDSFEDRRQQFQKKKAISADHKGILKVRNQMRTFRI